MPFRLFYKNKHIFPFDIQNSRLYENYFMKYAWIVKCTAGWCGDEIGF